MDPLSNTSEEEVKSFSSEDKTNSSSAPSSPPPPDAIHESLSDLSLSPSSSVTSPGRPRLPEHSLSAMAATPSMTPSSTPLGNVSAARRPAPTVSGRGGTLNSNPDLAAKMRAFHMSRNGAPAGGRPSAPNTPGIAGVPTPVIQAPGGAGLGGVPANFRLPPNLQRPAPQAFASSPAIAGRANRAPSLAEKRGMRMGLPGGPGGPPAAAGAAPAAGAPPAGRQRPRMSLSDMNKDAAGNPPAEPQRMESAMDRFSEFIDKETGSLKFKGKAILDSKGVKFSSGQTFSISLDEVDTLDELGKGNYGTVYKVRHSRPQIRRPGQGLAGNKALPAQQAKDDAAALEGYQVPPQPRGKTTGVVMAMKEMRLELEESKFATIIMELDVLHRCTSPQIVDFYGAFFQEGAVYICMEFMDGGSVDKIYGDGVPEGVLRKITYNTARGLKSLKDEHNIIHRDVKPTNILVNTAGAVKICDFGVSGNLVASIAKTNIGCQSYMAPERISSGGVAQAGANPGGGTYSVQSDIWSLGLSIIECAMGRYPYPPETYDNIFSQLSAIVDGEPPDLPADKFSEAARNFVAGCLNKIPKLRPTYAMLLQHAWLAPLGQIDTISEEDEEAAEAAEAAGTSVTPESEERVVGGEHDGEFYVDKEVGLWVQDALEKKRLGKLGKHAKPALHAAPLDATTGK